MIRPEVVYNYVEDVDPNLTCAICQSALVDPVTTASCKHTFCRDCITRALKHNPSCPIDRSALAPSSLQDTEPLVQLMLDELQVRCEAEGCGKVMQRGLLLSHIRSCTQAIVTCGDENCGLSMARHRMPHHRAYECFQRRMACSKCDITLTFKEAKDHAHSSCPPHADGQCASDKCEFCGDPLTTRPALHRWTCPSAPVPCSHAGRGCASIVSRQDLENHLASCPFEAMSSFFTITEARFTALERKFEQVQAENEGLRSQLWGVRRGLIVPRSLWGTGDDQPVVDISSAPSSPQQSPALVRSVQEGAPEGSTPTSTHLSSGSPRVVAEDGDVIPVPPPDVSPAAVSESTTAAHARLRSGSTLLPPPSGMSYTDWVVSRLPGPSAYQTEACAALRAAIIHLAAGLDSAERRSEVRITTESLRILEEVATLRAIIRPMRMQVLSDRPSSPHVNRFPSYSYSHSQSHDNHPSIPTPPLSTSHSLANETLASDSDDDELLARTSIPESVVFSSLGVGVLQHRSSVSSLATAAGSSSRGSVGVGSYAVVQPREWTGRPCAFPPAPPEPEPSGRTSRLSSLGASIFRNRERR